MAGLFAIGAILIALLGGALGATASFLLALVRLLHGEPAELPRCSAVSSLQGALQGCG